MKHATSGEVSAEATAAPASIPPSEKLEAEVEEMQRRAQEIVEVECDEVALDRD